ncbi:hypothetical protein RUM44_010754 [Polyplax serrata]|uniref:Uncharacterized protein n=1 Tax=Polyplax serrata TaxID=468196 RepID=A0ABR1AN33_POLSC
MGTLKLRDEYLEVPRVFAAYLWASVLSIYHEMMRKREEKKRPKNRELLTQFRRPRARSLLDESTLQKTAKLNSFDFKDVPQIILQMLRREEEMSEDSLLGPGMMLASVSNFGSYDSLKVSQSLGELGLLDMKAIQVMGIEDDEMLSPQEKALRFLKLNWTDVRKAQECRQPLDKEVFVVDKESWNKICQSHPQLMRPSRQRPEIVLQDASSPDLDNYTEISKKKSSRRFIELKFGFSVFSFIREKELRTDEREQVSSVENIEEHEEYEEEITNPMFMSNIREEVAVNRIRLNFVSKKMKGNAYAKLYKEEYMSVIGPEVFDRATKLPKVTCPVTPENTEPTCALFASDNVSDVSSTFLEEKETDNISDNCGSFYSFEEMSPNQRPPCVVAKEHLQEPERTPASECTLTKETEKKVSMAPEVKANDDDECEQLKKKQTCETVGPVVQQVKGKGEAALSSESCVDREKTGNRFCYRRRRVKIRRLRRQGKKLELILKKPSAESLDGGSDNDDGNAGGGCYDGGDKSSGWTKDRARNDRNNERCEGKTRNVAGECEQTAKKCEQEKKREDELRNCGKRTHRMKPLYVCEVLREYYTSKKDSHKRADSVKHPKRYNTLSNHSNLRNKTVRRAWKSKVLELVARNHPGMESKTLTFDSLKNFDCYFDMLGHLLTTNILNRRCRSPKMTNSKECQQKTSPYILSDHADAMRKSEESSNMTKLKRLRKKYLQLLKGTYSKSIVSSPRTSKKDLTVDEEFGHDPSDPQLVTKWMHSPFTDESHDESSAICMDTSNIYEIGMGKSLKQICLTESTGDLKNIEDFPPASAAVVTPVYYGHMEDDSICGGRESEESFSLYYSKAADLASPLLDVKRFIYPDHIHYSYKHVKKKGFDIDITGGLPLLVRESLTMNNPIGNAYNMSTTANPELEIIRRPMDLSFASTNAFAEWQSNESVVSCGEPEHPAATEEQKHDRTNKKVKKEKKSKKKDVVEGFGEHRRAPATWRKGKTLKDLKLETKKDHFLLEKLVRICRRLNNQKSLVKSEATANESPPVQISSMQLHSNKGRVNQSIYNPAIFLNEHKTKNEKKKMETQEERTKDMFARLEREVLLQSRNHNKIF